MTVLPYLLVSVQLCMMWPPSVSTLQVHPSLGREELMTDMKELMDEMLSTKQQQWQSDMDDLKSNLAQQAVAFERLRDELRKQTRNFEAQIGELNTQKSDWEHRERSMKKELIAQRTEIQNQGHELQRQKRELEELKGKHRASLFSGGKEEDVPQNIAKKTENEPRVPEEKDKPKPQLDETSGGDGDIERLRTRADDMVSLEPVVSQLTERLNDVSAELETVKEVNRAQDQAITAQEQATGSVYTRWGHASCPESADILYSGFIGGSWYDMNGGSSSYVCLPPNPVFDEHTVPLHNASGLFGAEYQTCTEPECDMNAVCSVCLSPRTLSVMIPAADSCHPGWTLEYSGYLMASDPLYNGKTEFICVDKSHGYVPSSKRNENGALLSYSMARCGSLSCPPFIEGRIFQCVVCTK